MSQLVRGMATSVEAIGEFRRGPDGEERLDIYTKAMPGVYFLAACIEPDPVPQPPRLSLVPTEQVSA